MRFSAFLTTFFLGLFLAAPSHAAWTLDQRPGYASTTTGGPGYRLELSCRRGGPLMLTLSARGNAGDLDGVRGLMMWITLPDGRTARWPVDVTRQGRSLTGPVGVSDYQLDFFRNGQSFAVDAPIERRQFLEGGMKGTGAARLAFLEQCGF